jgi:hypothetical protein
MIRRIFSFLIFAAIISSCGNTGKKEVAATEGTDAVKVEFASLIENPDNFVGKSITVEGKVVHVCTHSGKKLFIVGENPDVRLFIAAGEDMPKFPMELLGSNVVVEGLITKTAPVVAEAAAAAKPAATDEACETEIAVAAQVSLKDIVMEYKSHTVK